MLPPIAIRPSPHPKRTAVQLWLALALQARRDAESDEAHLRRRDREIARALPESATERERLHTWIEAVLAPTDRALAQRIEAGLRGLQIVLTAIGFLAGTGAAAAVYRYDGSTPINVLPALAVFVVLPVFLLLGFLVSAIPLGALRVLPGMAGLQEGLLALGGAWASGLLRLLPAAPRHALVEAFGQGLAHDRLFGRLQKWLLLAALQRFAVAFHVGAIAWFGARVFVTDLGFTWSATAEAVTPERVHAFVRALATPWIEIFPSAVPSLADVRATQYFRLGGGTLGDVPTAAADPTLLSHWWTFLLAAMVTYGLLPRVASAIFAAWRFRAAVDWTVAHAPVVRDALDRMAAPAVATRAHAPETSKPEPEATPEDDVDFPAAVMARVVVWSDAVDDARARELVRSVLATRVEDPILNAGAGHSIEEDESTAGALAEGLARDTVVVVVVKAWEPATMDAVDFVRTLRGALGDGRRVVVGAVQLHTGDEGVDQWRRRMKSIGDPWLRTVALDPGRTS